MEEITLLRDFAIIMTAAGAVTLLFRKLGQPLIPGYLIAGLIVGPHTFVSITVLITLWFIPLMLKLLSIGSFALAVPAILITFVVAIVLWSIFDIHGQLERTVSKALIGEEQFPTTRMSKRAGFIRAILGESISKLKLNITRIKHCNKDKSK